MPILKRFAVLNILFASLFINGCSSGSDNASLSPMQGLQTVVFGVPDLEKGKAWYIQAFGVEPYFDEPFYVGFDIGGYELGLDPDASVSQPPGSGPRVYWGVEDIEGELQRLLDLGATLLGPLQDVGGDIKTASVLDPFGNRIGLIYNPHFDPSD